MGSPQDKEQLKSFNPNSLSLSVHIVLLRLYGQLNELWVMVQGVIRVEPLNPSNPLKHFKHSEHSEHFKHSKRVKPS